MECAPSPDGVFAYVYKVGEADRQTVLPYLKSADVRMAFEKVDRGAADERCILFPTLWACRPVSELKLGTRSRDSLVFGNQDSIEIVFLRFAMACGCNFFWQKSPDTLSKEMWNLDSTRVAK